MKILSLTPKRKGLTAIFFEDGSECLIDSELIAVKNLNIGSNIEDIDELILASDFKRAKSRALWYLSRGDHSKKSLNDKLLQGRFHKETVEKTIERMEELGLLDDEKLAQRLNEYFLLQKMSKKEIYQKLLLKGIPSELAKQVAFCDCEDEIWKIRELISKKYAAKLTKEENVKKVYSALVRKGFSFSDIKKALREYSDELEICEDDYGV